MSNESTSGATATPAPFNNTFKVFHRPDQWDDWLDQTRWFMQQQEVWEYMNPEVNERPAEPQRPILPPIEKSIEAREAAEPTLEQRNIIRRIDLHCVYLPEFQEFSKKRDKANKYFTAYVDLKWHHYLADRPTLHSKLNALEQHVAPCEEARINALRTKFHHLQKGKPTTTSMSTYLFSWQLLERRMTAYQMSERGSLKHAFAKAINVNYPHVYNLLRSAGDITSKLLPPLDAMIEIVRHELTVEQERKPARTANATYQDGDDEKTAKKGGGGGKKKREKQKRGCGYITKKSDAEQCSTLRDCNVVNGSLWPEESDRTTAWKKAVGCYKQYCRDNRDFCERSANSFKNPAAIEVWEKHFGKKSSSEELHACATFRAANAASRQTNRQSQWLHDSCANTHVLNDVRRVDFKVTSLPEDSYIAAGSGHYRIVALGNCKISTPRIGGGTLTLTLLDVPYVPGFHTNIVSAPKLRKVGLWLHGRTDILHHEDRPVAQLLLNDDDLPCFDISTPISVHNERPPITEWPLREDRSPMSVDEAYRIREVFAAVSAGEVTTPEVRSTPEVRIIPEVNHPTPPRVVASTRCHHGTRFGTTGSRQNCSGSRQGPTTGSRAILTGSRRLMSTYLRCTPEYRVQKSDLPRPKFNTSAM